MIPRPHLARLRTLSITLALSIAWAVLASAHPSARPGWSEDVADQSRAPARSLDELRDRVKPGATVTITDEEGREVTGKITDLSTSTLALMVKGVERRFDEREIALVQQRQRDPEWNGAAIGAGILGGLMAVLILPECEASSGDCTVAVLCFTGVGAGIGTAVDATVQGKSTIFLRPGGGARANAVSLSPLVSPRSAGVRLAVRF